MRVLKLLACLLRASGPCACEFVCGGGLGVSTVSTAGCDPIQIVGRWPNERCESVPIWVGRMRDGSDRTRKGGIPACCHQTPCPGETLGKPGSMGLGARYCGMLR